MIYLVFLAIIGLIIFAVSKNFIVQIIMIKIIADVTLLGMFFLSKNMEEVRALGWIFYALAIISIFLLAVSGLHRSTTRELE